MSGAKQSFGGISGNAFAYIHYLDIKIGGTVFKDVAVAFSNEISNHGFGILGHRNLFDRFRLIFEFRKKQIEIIPKQYN